MPIPAGALPAYPSGWGTYRPATLPAADVYIELDSWIAPGVDDYGTTWILTKFDGWGGAVDLRNASADRPQDHGQFDAPSYWNARVMTIEGTAVAATRENCALAMDMLSSLAAWDTTTLYPLRVTEVGRPTRLCAVRLNGATKIDPVGGYSFDFSLQVKAPDPRRYADELTTLTLWPPSGFASGLTLPATAPLSLATTGLTHSAVTATNLGTTPTRPVVTFTGPLVDPQIAHVPSGRSLSMTITVAAGDVLVADFDSRTLLLNGSASRSNALTASAAWWELPVGGSEIRFTAGGGTGLATVRYRSAWI